MKSLTSLMILTLGFSWNVGHGQDSFSRRKDLSAAESSRLIYLATGRAALLSDSAKVGLVPLLDLLQRSYSTDLPQASEAAVESWRGEFVHKLSLFEKMALRSATPSRDRSTIRADSIRRALVAGYSPSFRGPRYTEGDGPLLSFFTSESASDRFVRAGELLDRLAELSRQDEFFRFSIIAAAQEAKAAVPEVPAAENLRRLTLAQETKLGSKAFGHGLLQDGVQTSLRQLRQLTFRAANEETFVLSQDVVLRSFTDVVDQMLEACHKHGTVPSALPAIELREALDTVAMAMAIQASLVEAFDPEAAIQLIEIADATVRLSEIVFQDSPSRLLKATQIATVAKRFGTAIGAEVPFEASIAALAGSVRAEIAEQLDRTIPKAISMDPDLSASLAQLRDSVQANRWLEVVRNADDVVRQVDGTLYLPPSEPTVENSRGMTHYCLYTPRELTRSEVAQCLSSLGEAATTTTLGFSATKPESAWDAMISLSRLARDSFRDESIPAFDVNGYLRAVDGLYALATLRPQTVFNDTATWLNTIQALATQGAAFAAGLDTSYRRARSSFIDPVPAQTSAVSESLVAYRSNLLALKSRALEIRSEEVQSRLSGLSIDVPLGQQATKKAAIDFSEIGACENLNAKDLTSRPVLKGTTLRPRILETQPIPMALQLGLGTIEVCYDRVEWVPTADRVEVSVPEELAILLKVSDRGTIARGIYERLPDVLRKRVKAHRLLKYGNVLVRVRVDYLSETTGRRQTLSLQEAVSGEVSKTPFQIWTLAAGKGVGTQETIGDFHTEHLSGFLETATLEAELNRAWTFAPSSKGGALFFNAMSTEKHPPLAQATSLRAVEASLSGYQQEVSRAVQNRVAERMVNDPEANRIIARLTETRHQLEAFLAIALLEKYRDDETLRSAFSGVTPIVDAAHLRNAAQDGQAVDPVTGNFFSDALARLDRLESQVRDGFRTGEFRTPSSLVNAQAKLGILRAWASHHINPIRIDAAFAELAERFGRFESTDVQPSK